MCVCSLGQYVYVFDVYVYLYVLEKGRAQLGGTTCLLLLVEYEYEEFTRLAETRLHRNPGVAGGQVVSYYSVYISL